MKTRFFILFFFILSIKGFAQEVNITLYPDTEFTTKANGFPVILNWESKENQIKIQLKGNGNKDKFIYFFKEIRLFKEIKEQDKDVWFSKEVQKKSDRNLVKKFWDNKTLVNCVYKRGPEIERRSAEIEYASLGANTIGEFRFAIKDPKEGQCKITIRAYIASTEKKSGRNRKIESMETFVFNITLHETICEMKELKTMINAVNEKTKELKKLEPEIDKYRKVSDCKKVAELKSSKADEYKVERAQSKYADCEAWKQAMEENEKIYLVIQNKPCTLPKEPVQSPPPPCDLILKKLKDANKELSKLFLQIRSGKADLDAIRKEYESEKEKVNSVYVPAYNTRCNGKEYKDVYDAYANWCKSIDGELK